MATMLVGTSVPPAAKTEEGTEGTGHRGEQQGDTLSASQRSAGGRNSRVLALSLAAPQWTGRKTEQSLKFVVCGDASAVNQCVLPTHAPPWSLHLLSTYIYMPLNIRNKNF